jgi:hypothetical protein
LFVIVLVLVVVLVLEKVHVMCDRPSPGGEPLWHVPGYPRDLRLNANTAETRENRRFPQTTQRDAFTRGLRFAYTRTAELRRAG